MSKQIEKIQSEKLKVPLDGTTSMIKKLSINSSGIFKSPFEQFITTQPGMIDLVNNICQNLTYDNSKSAKYVSKEFQIWIRNSELSHLAFEADAVVDKVITSINGSCFREHFGKVLTDVYKSVIGNFNANMLKILVELMKDHLEDVIKMASSVMVETDEILVSYQNYMMDLCVSFTFLPLLLPTMVGKNVQECLTLEECFESIIGK